jgi:hypothetical protein
MGIQMGEMFKEGWQIGLVKDAIRADSCNSNNTCIVVFDGDKAQYMILTHNRMHSIKIIPAVYFPF